MLIYREDDSIAVLVSRVGVFHQRDIGDAVLGTPRQDVSQSFSQAGSDSKHVSSLQSMRQVAVSSTKPH